VLTVCGASYIRDGRCFYAAADLPARLGLSIFVRKKRGKKNSSISEHARRGEARLGCGGGEFGVAGVEGVVAVEGDAQVVAEDDAVWGEKRRAKAGVA
jgi:hypothetical protein